jgi:probable phosphoglycerate mutase
MTQNGHDRTTVYLIRHGETEWNIQRRWQGQADIPLNKSGVQQAQLLAEWIQTQDVAFNAIYSSDLKRSFMTAQAIADRLQLETSSSQAWREIHVGEATRSSSGQLSRVFASKSSGCAKSLLLRYYATVNLRVTGEEFFHCS